MSRSARQSSKTTSKSSYRPASRPFVARAGKDSFFGPSGSVPAIQTKMTVNKPGDKFEQEADRMADMVTQSKPSASGPKVNRQAERKLQRAEDQKLQKAEPEKLQKAEDPQLQKADDQKLQKAEAEKLQKADDDKLQKAEEPQLQKAEDQKLQKAEAEKLQKADDDELQKADDQQLQKAEEEEVQRRASGDGSGAVGGSVQSAIHGKTTGGDPLPSNVRDSMEGGFNADFSNVRVHTDPESASLNNQLSARAFTYQNHIFFSRDQFQPGTSSGQHLLAHELTHTIQQGHSVQRSPAQVSTTTATPTVQRLGIQDALDKFAGWANAIPGFRLLTLVLGFNPISRRSVDRNAANLLRALIELLPGGFIITQALDNHGVINKAAAWVEAKISELGDIGSDLAGALRRFLDSLSWTDIFDLGGVWDRAKKIFTEPISRLLSFGGRVVIELLKLVKDAILKPLAVLAKGTRGYDLLCALLGEDPISGEPVPPTAENLLGGFMKLIGQEEIWENIKKGNAIARAWAWFQGALSGLMGMVRAIPQRIIATITSLTFTDIVTVVGAFAKIVGNFASIAIDFVTWGLNTVWDLLEIIFDVVKPGLMGYVKRTGAALKSILKNPLPFLGNLIRAAKLGFTQFKSRFGTHLKQGLIDWLTGSLEGVYIPKAFSLGEFGKFAMSVLGITWLQIRGKIVKALGPNGERIMAGLETAFDIVKTLVTGGVAAVWNLIKAKLTNLKETLVSGIVGFVVSTIVTKAVPKLLAIFIPGAGFISAIISIYDTIMVFVQKLAKIVQVVTAFIDSIVTIAAGNVAAAANRVESILAGLLSLSISFLAGFLGLGRISSKVMDVVKKVRTRVDKAIEAAVNWVVGKAKGFIGTVKAGMRKLFQWWKKKTPLTVGGESHSLQFEGQGRGAKFVIRSEPEKPSQFLEKKYEKAKKPGLKKGSFVSKTQTEEAKIAGIVLDELPKITDAQTGVTPLTGPERENADSIMGRLDSSIAAIGGNVTGAYSAWGLKHANDVVGPISLGRSSFSRSDKVRLAEQHEKHFKGFKVEGKPVPSSAINKERGTFKRNAQLDRRHVVSSQDMIEHYKSSLEGKTIAEAGILISQRASNPSARVAVTDDTKAGVEAAAKKRYGRFFSYVNNLFIGNASTNRSLGQMIDPHHPGLVQPGALDNHVARIKREWSFGSGFTVSGMSTTDTVNGG